MLGRKKNSALKVHDQPTVVESTGPAKPIPLKRYKQHGATHAIIKKQLLELLSMFTGKGRRAKSSKKSIVGVIIVLIIAYGVLVGGVTKLGAEICEVTLTLGKPWIFFAIMGILSLLLGIMGTVFMAYSAIYMAKDNDILLAMPLKPGMILSTRVMGCFLMAAIFEWLILIPAIAVYIYQAGFSFTAFLGQLSILIFLPMMTIALSAILAWVIAAVAKRVPYQNFIRVFLSLLFFGIYYWFCFRAYEYVQLLLLNLGGIGAGIHKFAYPLYLLGRACVGHPVSLLLFAVMSTAAFALVYFVLSRTFLSLATAGGSKRKVKAFTAEDLAEKSASGKQKSTSRTLLGREIKHYLSSSSYMLNCSLGTAFGVIAAVALIIKGSDLRDLLGLMPADVKQSYWGWIMLGLCAIVAFLVGNNILTAPSISIEGQSLWILQSLPVKPMEIIRSKVSLHLLLTLPPALLVILAMEIVTRPGLFWGVALPVFATVFVLTTAVIGMYLGLKFPRLDWKEENMAVKQGMAVFLALIIDWVLIAILGGFAWFMRTRITPEVFFGIAVALLAGLTLVLWMWIRKNAPRLFLELL